MKHGTILYKNVSIGTTIRISLKVTISWNFVTKISQYRTKKRTNLAINMF